MTVRIASGLLARIVSEAERSPGLEVCGLLLGAGDVVEEVLACRNVAEDPARRFEIDPAALLAAHRAARGGGVGIVGCYHSHPGGRAVPSVRDATDAAGNGWVWVIVGGGAVRAWRAVEGGAVHGRFVEVGLVVDVTVSSPADPPPTPPF